MNSVRCKTSTLAIAALAGFALASCAAPGPDTGNDAAVGGTGSQKIEIVSGETVDWGDVPPSDLSETVVIKNAGGDTLRLSGVDAACGCTTAPLHKTTLAPGDTTQIAVTVAAGNFTGPQHKTITIKSDDPERPNVVVGLKANIIRDIVADPGFFPAMGNITAGTEFTTKVKLSNTGSEAVTIKQPYLSEPVSAVVRFEPSAPVTIKPGDSIEVVAHVKPISAGTLNAEVVVPSNSKISPELRLTLAAAVAEG